MTDKTLKRLSRSELLELLLAQTREREALEKKLEETQRRLEDRQLQIEKAGDIAHAVLEINGVMNATQAAAQQYLDNIKLLSERQQEICEKLEQESREKADALIAETTEKCDEMLAKAKAESQAYWDEVSQRLEAFYNEHHGLRELLASVSGGKPEVQAEAAAEEN